ncbi:MAG: S24 family peptidase [Patescibacteria group bacterium]|nr:S24 family peptidase [Patescibacteria group bacterium]
MAIHKTQTKLLELAEKQNLAGLTLRKIGELIGEPNSPQKIKHHLNKLFEKGLLVNSLDNKKISKTSTGFNSEMKLISLPIYGSANCGQALELADDKIQGYLKISPSILKEKFRKKIKDLYILKAIGYSMNRANINNNNIEHGDYLIIDKSQNVPEDNDYVVSVIDGAANIKKFYSDKKNQRIILKSESTNDFAPIYIHANDLEQYAICGKVIDVLKEPEDFNDWQDAGLSDTLKALGPMSDEEHNYYMNL